MRVWIIESKSKKVINFLSKLIMKIQKIDFSHMALMMVFDDGSVTIYHAKWPVPVKVTVEQFFKEYQIVNCYCLKKSTYVTDAEMVDFANTLIQEKNYYSISQLFLIWFQIQFSKIKSIAKMVILNHEHGLICSEFIARCLNFGWRLKFEEGYDSIDLVSASEKAKTVKDDEAKWHQYL